MKLYGYNFYGIPVPLPISGNKLYKFYSQGHYVMGFKNKQAFIVRRHQIEPYPDSKFIERCIKDGSYLEFEDHPFMKNSDQWERETSIIHAKTLNLPDKDLQHYIY